MKKHKLVYLTRMMRYLHNRPPDSLPPLLKFCYDAALDEVLVYLPGQCVADLGGNSYWGPVQRVPAMLAIRMVTHVMHRRKMFHTQG